MKLVDVKLPKKTKKELKESIAPVEVERDQWPYGLRLTFDREQMGKLPHLKEMKIGERVSVSGTGEVVNIRMNEKKGGKDDYSVEIQIQKVGIEGSTKTESLGDAIKRYEKSRTTG